MHDNVKALARRLLDGEQMNLPREGALDRPKDGKSIPDSFVQQLVLLIFCSSYLSHQTVEWCRTVCSSSERPSPFVTGLGCDSTWLERHGGMVSTWFILLPDFIVRTLQNFWCSNPCIQNSHRCQRGKLPSKNLSTRQRRVQIWICLNIFKYLWHVLALERVASLRLNHIESRLNSCETLGSCEELLHRWHADVLEDMLRRLNLNPSTRGLKFLTKSKSKDGSWQGHLEIGIL